MLGVLLHGMLHASDPCIMFLLMLHVVFHVALPASCHVRIMCFASCCRPLRYMRNATEWLSYAQCHRAAFRPAEHKGSSGCTPCHQRCKRKHLGGVALQYSCMHRWTHSTSRGTDATQIQELWDYEAPGSLTSSSTMHFA